MNRSVLGVIGLSVILSCLVAGAASAQEAAFPEPPAGAKRLDRNGKIERDMPRTMVLPVAVDAPDSDAIADYVNFIARYRAIGKKQAMIYAAYLSPFDYDARTRRVKNGCVQHHEAFSFKQVDAKNDIWEVSCYSGNEGARVDAVVYYKMKISYQPAGCDSDNLVRKHFESKVNRNKVGATAYATSSGGIGGARCLVKAEYVDPRNPADAYGMTADDVAKMLNTAGRTNLREHLGRVSSSRKAKTDDSGSFHTRVRVEGVSKDDEEGDTGK